MCKSIVQLAYKWHCICDVQLHISTTVLVSGVVNFVEKYIEDITRWQEGMNFMFKWQT